MARVPTQPMDDPTAAQSEARFRALVEAISDYAIYMLDTSGVIQSWNAGAEQITGYTASEMIGQHFTRLFTMEDLRRGAAENALAAAMRDGRYASEGWRVRKDGGRFWALSVVELVHDEAGHLSGFVKIVRDMSAQRAAQEAVIESERRFRLLVNGVTDYALYMLDPMGIVINWNPGAERIKGYTADEIVGQHFSKFYLPEDRKVGLPARALERAEREGRFEGEGWRLRKDGGRFWASVVIDPIRDETGTLVGFAKITRDITERREAQEALRESERQFRMLVASVTDYAIFMLDPNGIVTNWNAGAQKIKQYQADEIIGQHFSRFYSEADRAAGLPMRTLTTAAETGRFETEGWRVRKDGSLFFANVVIDAIRDENGQLIGFAKITRDITERREAQAALTAAQEQLAQSQKMEALGKLTGGVAHDFNNLLMIVGGHAQMLRRRMGDDPKALRALQAIETATERGQSLTRQMLSFSRRGAINPETIDLNRWMASFEDMITAPVSGRGHIEIAFAPGLWPVHVDVSELELALLNLVINARDAMPDGGVITLEAENVVLPGKVRTPLRGDFVALHVSDTGVGIPEDILPRVFDPFFTTKQIDKGAGLGLSQVYGFAKQSDGFAVVDSKLGRGTVVTIYIPRALQAPAPISEAPTDTPTESPLTVLLVEDNPDVLAVTTTLLEELGHTVRAVESADVALATIERGEKVDLVLSDIVMAGRLDGIGLARAVRQAHPDVPVVLATGYSKAAEEAQHEFPILRKPYSLTELGQTLTRVVARQRERTGANLVDFLSAKKGRAPKD